MKTLPKAKWLAILGVAILWSLSPGEARADSINVGFVAVAGVVVLVPLLVFEVFVEAVFLAVGIQVPYRKVLLLSLGANLASLAAGIPVKIFNALTTRGFCIWPVAPSATCAFSATARSLSLTTSGTSISST